MVRRRVTTVGVTGGIGSGKSTVCRLFAMLGVPVYDSDRRSRELMTTDAALMASVREAFGEEAYVGGQINRPYLASIVFNDAQALQRLNSISHPAVMRDFRQWASGQVEDAPGYVIMESAIIFEAGLEAQLDRIITVSAPEQMRIERVVTRDNTCRTNVQARLANQMTDAQREARADYVIRNDGTVLVWEQVLAIDAEFRRVGT